MFRPPGGSHAVKWHGPYHQNTSLNMNPPHDIRQYNFTKNSTTFICYYINLLKPTGHVMHQQFNIQQLYALPTLYLCVLYLSENKQRLVPLTT